MCLNQLDNSGLEAAEKPPPAGPRGGSGTLTSEDAAGEHGVVPRSVVFATDLVDLKRNLQHLAWQQQRRFQMVGLTD
jgi:hypothetical protein